jgi:translation initiation factor IF-1
MTSQGPLKGTVQEVLPHGRIRVFIGGGEPFVEADPQGRDVQVADGVRLEAARDDHGRLAYRVTGVSRPSVRP